MSFWFRAWRWIAGISTLLYITWRVYKFKSQLYRWIWERRFLSVELKLFTDLRQLPDFMDFGRKWRSDSWLQMFDSISSPQYAQQVFSGEEPVPKHGLDCDEHAIFLVAAIRNSLEKGMLLDSGYANPKLLTVTWVDLGTGKAGGHNVCMLEVLRGTLPPQYAFMDYHDPRGLCGSPEELALFITKQYAPAAVLLLWAVQEEDLTPVRVRRLPV